MAKFYGQVFGKSGNAASRLGTSGIRVSAQSWHGSVHTELWHNDEKGLMVTISTSPDSSPTGSVIFSGTFEEFQNKLKEDN